MSTNTRLIALLVTSNIITYASGIVLANKLLKERYKYEKLYEMSGYLVDIIEKNDIELNEFDVIALGNLQREHDASK